MTFKAGATPAFLSFTITTNYGLFDFAKPTNPMSPSTTSTVTTTAAAMAMMAMAPAPQSLSLSDHHASTFCRKRARPLADIDGCCREATKKRRLRLTFVTSRLSDPFASPPTNNVDRGNCKMAVWAKQRCTMASTQFRKAAILNRIKREAIAAREAQQRQIELARQQYCQQQLAIAQAAAAQPPAAAPQRSSKRTPRKTKNNVQQKPQRQQKSSKKIPTPDSSPEQPSYSRKRGSTVTRVYKPVPIAPASPIPPPAPSLSPAHSPAHSFHHSPLPSPSSSPVPVSSPPALLVRIPLQCRPPTPPNEAEIEKEIQLQLVAAKQRTSKKKERKRKGGEGCGIEEVAIGVQLEGKAPAGTVGGRKKQRKVNKKKGE